MNPIVKGIVLLVGAYIVTMAVAIFASFAMMLLLQPNNCSAYGDALLALWGTIAIVFLGSVIVTGVVARQIIPATAGRLAIILVHGASMLAHYGVIAFTLIIAFNC